MKKMKRAFAIIEGLVVAALIALIVLVFAVAMHREKVVMPEAYQAWVKQTGNTNQLTYAEWRRLLSATRRQDNSTIIFIPY